MLLHWASLAPILEMDSLWGYQRCLIDGKEPWEDEKEGLQASRRRRNMKTRQACLPDVSAWYWRLTCSEGPWDGPPTQLFPSSVTAQTQSLHKQPHSLVANSCAEDSPGAGAQIAQLPGLAVLTFTSGRHCLHTFTCVFPQIYSDREEFPVCKTSSERVVCRE